MKLFLALLLTCASAWAQFSEQDGVLVQKTGPAYLYVFPASQGRLRVTSEPSGNIKVGTNIVVMYMLHVQQGGKSRFIQLDAAKVPESVRKEIVPKLEAALNQKKVDMAFIVKDSTQRNLNINIGSGLMATIRRKAQEKAATEQQVISRQGNLNVTFKRGKTTPYQVESINID